MAQDLVWIWYLVTVSTTVAIYGWNAPEGRPLAYVGTHLTFLAILLLVQRLVVGRPALVGRAARTLFVIIVLPLVFSSMAWTLPAVHPEPYEWTWMAWDRALLGTDPTVAAQKLLVPWFTEILQWVYASFYVIPIAAVGVMALKRDGRSYDRTLMTITFCFLFSYLGYYIWPTLPPFRYLPHETPIVGVWMAESIYAAIDGAEVHKWNCFPSGHTMISLVCVVMVWRYCRPAFFVMAPVVALLVASTVILRYHYFVDVVAGILFIPPALWIADRVYVWSESPNSSA